MPVYPGAQDLHLQVSAPCRAHQRKREGQALPLRQQLLAERRNLWGRCLLQRGIVDDEAVFHVLLQQTVKGLVDLLYADLLDVRGDAVLAAEI